MNRVRRDVLRVCVRQREWRLAMTVLFMPAGYSLTRRLPYGTTAQDAFIPQRRATRERKTP